MTSGDMMAAVDTIIGIDVLLGLVGAFMGGSEAPAQTSAPAKKRRHKPSAAVIPKAKSPSVSLPVKPKPAIKNKPSAAVLKAKSPSTDILKAKSSAPAKPSRASGRKYNLPRAE